MSDEAAKQTNARHHLRKKMCKQRADLSADQQTLNSDALLKNLFLWFDSLTAPKKNSLKKTGGYLAFGGEIKLTPAFRWLRELGHQIFLPVIVSENGTLPMLFAPFTTSTTFTKGAHNISIPNVADSELLPATELDLVLVPLVSFDTSGNRLGMGGGYYDRTFSFRRTTSNIDQLFIGVAHEIQRSDGGLPIEDWDIPLDAVITDQNIYNLR